jgi:CRISPR-associated endonuclease/helicase Cas3
VAVGPASATSCSPRARFGTKDVRADREARTAAGVPTDLRHEVESVGVLLDAFEREPPPDVDVGLLLHLVGTHHGLGRPVPRLPRGGLAPRRYLVDVAGLRGIGVGDRSTATRDGAWVARFLDVVERYGAWGSAYLAALLMLADREVSAEGG